MYALLQGSRRGDKTPPAGSELPVGSSELPRAVPYMQSAPTMDTAPRPTRKKMKKSKAGAGAATASAPTKKKTKTKTRPCKPSPPAAADNGPAPAEVDMLSALPPMLMEHILLASCDDGGSTEAIGAFAATSKGNALAVAGSRPVWQAVLTKRFNTDFATNVLQKHKAVTDAPVEEKTPAAAKKKPAATKTAAEPPAASSPSSIRECAYFIARLGGTKSMTSDWGGTKPRYTGKVCDFCLARSVSLNSIGKQIETATGSICCKACCKIHTVNTANAIAKYGATKGVLNKIKPVATKQWYGRTSKLYMRNAARGAALDRFKGDSSKLLSAISKKKPQVNGCGVNGWWGQWVNFGPVSQIPGLGRFSQG